MDSFAVDFADGILAASQLRAATERMRASLTDVEDRMADAGRVDILGPVIGAADVKATWIGLPLARKRAVIDTLMSVKIHPPGRGVRHFDSRSVTLEPKTAA
jgi:hypothetical protein